MIGELLMVKVEAMSEKAVSQATGSVAVSEGEGDMGFLPFQLFLSNIMGGPRLNIELK
jgi:hypothetical protein